jgi:hypothetical protein
MTKPNHTIDVSVAYFFGLWNWFIGGSWKNLNSRAREVLKYCNLSIMNSSEGSSEDQNADRNADSGGQAHEDTFWQRTCLLFVYGQRLCGMLSLKVETN